MDEPTSALAEGQIFKVFQLVRQLKARGLAIIYISHQLEEIFEIADRVTVLRNGSSCGTFPLSEIDEANLVCLIVGRDFTSYTPGTTATSFGAEALAVKGLTHRGVYEDINMVVHEGEIVGIFGQVGAGRTELLRGIFGVDPVDAGEIRVAGTPVRIDSPITAICHGLGFLTEDRKGQGLVPCMGVADNIVLASLDFISRRGLIDLERRNAIAGRFVQELNIKTPDLNRWVKFLSGGNQQKVILARWLSRSCRVLLLDEPMKGIDVGAKTELRRLMRDLAGKGVALIVVFSDPAEVLDICDRILVMREGRITGDFLQGEVTKERLIACSI
ncbi:MAG: sugar ABC transporter ATP-binding protein [Chloroflexi bacterium]|nr:sugar ABC transporter ATP-binding protein [Chloroflexota bacterium]